MRKWILLLVFILVVLSGYRITTVYLEKQKHDFAIEKAVESFYEAISKGELGPVMNYISTDYAGFNVDMQGEQGEPFDYAALKSLFQIASERFVDFSFSDFKILKLNIQDNNATLIMECNFSTMDLNSGKERSGKAQREFSLVKEGDSWKITQISMVVRRDKELKR